MAGAAGKIAWSVIDQQIYRSGLLFFQRGWKNQVQIVVEDGKVISDAWGERKGTYYEAKVAMG